MVAKSTAVQAGISNTPSGNRTRKLKSRQQKQLEKKEINTKPLPSAWQLLKNSLVHLYRNKKLFLGILLVYGLLYTFFVKGISENFQLNDARQSIQETFGNTQSPIQIGISLYGVLLGSAGTNSTDLAGLYQTIFVIIISLALIWSLRKTYKDTAKIRIRDAFYKSTAQLTPFVIVLLFIGIQSLPAIIATSIYSNVIGNNIAVSGLEQLVATAILLAGLLWTFYMVSSSSLAMYIVTLPGKTPREALKAAKELVKNKRLIVLRKIFFLPVLFFIISAAVLIPLIIFLTPMAELLFLLFTILALGITHSYLYSLYRSLL